MNYGPRVITSNVVLALDAADRNSYPNSGTLWKDLSGNGIHFNLGCAGTGCAVPSYGGNAFKTSYTASTANWALYQGGSSTVNLLPYGDHTIEIACKINSFAVGLDLNAAYTTETYTSLINWAGFYSGLYLANSGNCTYSISNGASSSIAVSTLLSSYLGQNIMIHAVRISNTLYIYVNGALVVSAVKTATLNDAHSRVIIGSAGNGNVVSGNNYTWPSNVDFYSVKLSCFAHRIFAVCYKI
jgi:hypothetical protein